MSIRSTKCTTNIAPEKYSRTLVHTCCRNFNERGTFMGRVQDRPRTYSSIERLHLVRVMLLVLLSGVVPVFGQSFGANGVPGESATKPPVATYAGSANAPAAIPNPK